MGALENRIRNTVEELSRNRDIKGKELKDFIISVLFKDGHVHTILPDDQKDVNQILSNLQQYSYDENKSPSYNRLKEKLLKEISSLAEHDEVKNRSLQDLWLSLLFTDGHIHHVIPDVEPIRDKLLEDIQTYAKHPAQEPGATIQKEPPKEIVFHNRQAIGDILTMTCAVRDFKSAFPNTRVGVITTARHIWDNNPYIDHNFIDDDKILKIGPGFLTNKSNLWNLHMCNAFRLDIENKLGLTFPQGPIRPDIWLTEEEYNRPPLIEGPYWVIIVGGEPGWTAKMYPMDGWQKVIDSLPNIKFVQLGVKGHPYPHLKNCIDFIGRTEDRNTGVRDLFNIFLHAQGSVGLVSMHMHLSAAFNNACVVLAAAREPAWFTQYFGQQYLQTNGTLSCAETKACWKCDVTGCPNKSDKNVPKCVEIIEPEEISEAIRKYYKGGRLEYGKKISNNFFKNVTKEKRVFVVPQTSPIDNDQLQKHGFQWGGGSVTDKDWIFIKGVLSKYNIKTVLEFGAGLSTILFANAVDNVLTYETSDGWIKQIKAKLPENKGIIVKWDGKNFIPQAGQTKFDLCFVDGPAGGENREISTKVASELADFVIVHDAGREAERRWQDKHLAPTFDMVSKGGHRCHFWARKQLGIQKTNNFQIEQQKQGPCVVADPTKPLARMITTCRGYGGSERSTVEIMRMFLQRGYVTQLIPTGNISGEYGRNIPQGVIVGGWDEIKTPCDISVLYCSDTIWNYNKPQYEIMNQLSSKRKVMVVNYKVGSVGQTPWTKDWDLYLFLNSEHEKEVLARMPNVKTKSLPPPTDLSIYYQNQPDYSMPLKLIRHSSQGDSKYPDYTNQIIQDILHLDQSIQFFFMPAKSDMIEHINIHKHQKNIPPVWDFLKQGNCFIYFLPPGYTEGGPKVIMEAQASGLPIICDNHSGPKDRVNNETGWKCDNYNQYLDVIKEILSNPDILRIKGEAARKWAMEQYKPENWINEIIGEQQCLSIIKQC